MAFNPLYQEALEKVMGEENDWSNVVLILSLNHGFDEALGISYSNDMTPFYYDSSRTIPEAYKRKAGFSELPFPAVPGEAKYKILVPMLIGMKLAKYPYGLPARAGRTGLGDSQFQDFFLFKGNGKISELKTAFPEPMEKGGQAWLCTIYVVTPVSVMM